MSRKLQKVVHATLKHVSGLELEEGGIHLVSEELSVTVHHRIEQVPASIDQAPSRSFELVQQHTPVIGS